MEEELEQMGAPLAIQRQSRRLWQDWTAARSVLWNILSNTRPYQGLFQRLTIIGGYAVDFCAPQRRLVVEIDGDPADAAVAGDAERLAALEREGYRVLRFRSDQVLNQPLSVLRAIEQACDQRSPHAAQTPSPSSPNATDRRDTAHAAQIPSPSSPNALGEEGRGGEGLTWAHVSPATRERAQQLRANPTAAEALLWQQLRAHRFHGLKFRRQHPIGRFIADFYCHAARLVIELDGDAHDRERDAERTRYLQERGYRLVRFRNAEVLRDLPAVLAAIEAACAGDQATT